VSTDTIMLLSELYKRSIGPMYDVVKSIRKLVLFMSCGWHTCQFLARHFRK